MQIENLNRPRNEFLENLGSHNFQMLIQLLCELGT